MQTHPIPEQSETQKREKIRKIETAIQEDPHKGVALAGSEGQLLLAHGLGVELGEGIGGAAEGGVHGPIGLVQARGVGLPLLGHRRRLRRQRNPSPGKKGGGFLFAGAPTPKRGRNRKRF